MPSPKWGGLFVEMVCGGQTMTPAESAGRIAEIEEKLGKRMGIRFITQADVRFLLDCLVQAEKERGEALAAAKETQPVRVYIVSDTVECEANAYKRSEAQELLDRLIRVLAELDPGGYISIRVEEITREHYNALGQGTVL